LMFAFSYNNLDIYLYMGLFLFACGIIGLIYRRTMIGMFISLELIMNGAGLNLVAFNRFMSPDDPSGMVFTLFIMGIAAAEAAIALALIILLFRRFKSLEGDEFTEMKD